MPSEDSKKKEEAVAIPVENDKAPNKNDKNDKKPEELSEEDLALKEGLELAVQRLQEEDTNFHAQALNHLINEIRSSTSSMTSVPKPLKFLRPFYDTLKTVYNSWLESHHLRQSLADVLSVLAMTMAAPGSLECLKFKLEGTTTDIAAWGHEYVRSLAGEIAEEYNKRSAEFDEEMMEDEYQLPTDLEQLVDDILPFQMHHNAEAEAVDLLMEIRRLDKLLAIQNLIDERNFERVCLYLIRFAAYVYDPEDLQTVFITIYEIYKRQGKYCNALRIALKMDDDEKVKALFTESTGK
jgi:26S proteasome regulatory subunit N1